MNCNSKFKCCSILSIGVVIRTLLHIQDRLKVEHSLQDLLFKTAIKGSPPAQPQRYRSLKISSVLSERWLNILYDYIAN